MTDDTTAREQAAAEAWADYRIAHGYSTTPVQSDTGADFDAGFERGWDTALRSRQSGEPQTSELLVVIEAARAEATELFGPPEDQKSPHAIGGKLHRILAAVPVPQSNEGEREVAKALVELLEEHGDDWPWTTATRILATFNVTRKAVS